MSILPETAHATAEAVRMALRVTVGKRRKDQADQDYKTVQSEAQQVFAEYRRRGFPQIEVRTPDGTKVALISIERGADFLNIDEDVLTGVIAVNEPEAFEDYALPVALADPEVLELLMERFPQYVAARIKPDVLAQYQKEALENSGRVFLRGGSGAGEQVQAGAVDHYPASGKYSVRWEPKGMSLLGDAIDAGEVTHWGEIPEDLPPPGQDVAGGTGPTITGPGQPADPDDSGRRLDHAKEQLDKQAKATPRARRTSK